MRNHSLKYSLFVLLAFIGFTGKLQAQDSITFPQLENRTYRYYMNGQWDSLVSTGKAGLHEDMDYFYLRLRMGIAYYYKENYCRAIRHLGKALSFNSDDTTSSEYLYYSYKDYNRPLDQRKVAKKYHLAGRRNMTYDFHLNNNSFVPEMGYQIDQAFTPDNNELIGFPTSKLYGEIDHPLSFVYYGLKYRHYFGGLALNVFYDHLDSEREKTSVYPEGFVPDKFTAFTDKYNVSEHHFYVNTEISLFNSLVVVPALHYQYTKLSKFNAQWDSINFTYSFPMTTYTYNNFIASLAVNKDIDMVSLGLTASYTRLYDKNIFQEALIATVLPFGNSKLYSTTTLAFIQFPSKGKGGKGNGEQQQSNASTTDESHAVIEEAIGARIAHKIWLEAQFAYNGLRGYNKDNAGILYNSPEQINYSLGFTGIYEITKSLELTLGYVMMQKDLTGIHYTGINTYTTDHYLKYCHTIYGGLKWKL